MDKGKTLGLLALIGWLSACTTLPDFSPLPYRARIEFALMPGALPFPEESITQALHTMRAELSAFSGHDIALVDALAPFDAETTRRCFIHFTRPGTGRYSAYVAQENSGQAIIDGNGNCALWLRGADMQSLNYLANALIHEGAHAILGGYHNPDPASIMYPVIREGEYRFTERDLQMLDSVLP